MEASHSSSSTSSNTSSFHTWLACVRSHYMGKQHGEASLMQELWFWLGCLLEVRLAGSARLTLVSCAELVQMQLQMQLVTLQCSCAV